MKYVKMEATLDFAYSDFGGQIVKKALWKAVRAGVKDSKATASRTFGYEKQRNRATAKETGWSRVCLCLYVLLSADIREYLYSSGNSLLRGRNSLM